MAKKDKKSKDAEKKARVAAKQSKKTAQKEKKVRSKGADDSDAEDIDLESVLEEYAKQVSNSRFQGILEMFQAAHGISKPNSLKSRRISANPLLLAHRLLSLARLLM